MENGELLELATLPTIHPRCGFALLSQCATSAIVRMAIDPLPIPTGILERMVSVSWLAQPGICEATQLQRSVGWSGIPQHSNADLLLQWTVGIPTQDVTEQAAIAVMALLLHDLGQAEILEALPIGSGGDYLVKIVADAKPIQAECSGIREDPNGGRSRSRLSEKKGQVLSKCHAGFAAVTTFHHPPKGIVQSYLHYVCRTPVKKSGKRTRQK